MSIKDSIEIELINKRIQQKQHTLIPGARLHVLQELNLNLKFKWNLNAERYNAKQHLSVVSVAPTC